MLRRWPFLKLTWLLHQMALDYGGSCVCLDEDYFYLLEELVELGTPARLLEVVRLGHLWSV